MTTLDIAHRWLSFSRAVPTNILHFLARVVVTPADARILLEELSRLSERPMIIRMTTTSRPQRRDDHRLRDLVQRTGDLTITTDLGVPRSTARGWLRATPTMVVSLEVRDLTEHELRQEILNPDGTLSAAEVGATAATFPSPKHLASWMGACPGTEESAGKNYSHRCPKGNRQMRRVLNQAANAAVKAKGTIFAVVYRRIVPRLGHTHGHWCDHPPAVRLSGRSCTSACATKNGGRPSAPRRRKCGRAR